MEDDQKTPQPAEDTMALTPLDIIRTETVLSRLPVHNLSKKGSSISINITRKNQNGEVDLSWKVSPSRDYGEPGQLAYKLDTIIIDRAIDEAGKPLPERIRLGSLREIAKELGVGTGNITVLKKAFLQNTFAGITAKLGYRANDGTEKTLEAAFTRYSVVFAGEKMPDGTRADAVYIIINPTYREVLNNAPVRPLDMGYKKRLAPTPQRFYEVISYRMFAALKFGHGEARLNYSDYCTYSAQQRYFSYDQFKKQMYKVHKPHLDSGYIIHVRYEDAKDEEGRPDWIMCYTPGPKAKGEFRTFTRTGRVPSSTSTETEDVLKIRRHLPRQEHFSFKPDTSSVDEGLLAQLVSRGISPSRAKKLLAELPPTQEVGDVLEWGDYLISQSGFGSFRNPPGFYVYLLRDNITPPDNFETSRRRRLREEAHRSQAEAEARRAALEFAYEEYRHSAVDEYIRQHVKPEDLAKLIKTKTTELRRKQQYLPLQTVERIAERAVRVELAKVVNIPTFESFCKERESASA